MKYAVRVTPSSSCATLTRHYLCQPYPALSYALSMTMMQESFKLDRNPGKGKYSGCNVRRMSEAGADVMG